MAIVFVHGVPETAAWMDPTMADCILALYRSATNIAHEWAPAIVDIKKPGLVVIPEHDPFLVTETAVRTAQRCGAQAEHLKGLGHWWVLQAPERGAEMLTRFWKSLS